MKNTIGAWNVQRVLKHAGLYKGGIDGDIGPGTLAGVEKALTQSNYSPVGALKFPTDRRLIAALQVILCDAGYAMDVGEVDGYAGPSTRYAYTCWELKRTTGMEPRKWRPDDEKPEAGPPIAVRGTSWGTQKEVERRFGKAGGSQCTAGLITLPFKMRIAWNKAQTIQMIHCHEKIAASAQRVLERINSSFSPAEIVDRGFDLFGGCYNYRKKRGGKTLSMHAYGVAFDFDPERNQLKWKKERARFGKPDCDLFFKLWSQEGFTALGPKCNFDYMHVQAPSV